MHSGCVGPSVLCVLYAVLRLWPSKKRKQEKGIEERIVLPFFAQAFGVRRLVLLELWLEFFQRGVYVSCLWRHPGTTVCQAGLRAESFIDAAIQRAGANTISVTSAGRLGWRSAALPPARRGCAS